VCCNRFQCNMMHSLQTAAKCVAVRCSVVQCVTVRCSALQCAAVCCSALQCVAACCTVLHCTAVCCSVLQHVDRHPFRRNKTHQYIQIRSYTRLPCVAVCCSTLQRAAMCRQTPAPKNGEIAPKTPRTYFLPDC